MQYNQIGQNKHKVINTNNIRFDTFIVREVKNNLSEPNNIIYIYNCAFCVSVYLSMYLCWPKSQRNLYLAPGRHQVVKHCTGFHVQVYRSENHFGRSELRVLKGVHATHTQNVNGGLCFTYSDQNIIQCAPSSNSKCTEVKIILVEASCMC